MFQCFLIIVVQVCSAGSKLLVQESIWDRFISKLKERMTRLRVGNSLEKHMDVGATIDESQRKSVEEYVESARREGADVSNDSNAP
jgi:aldehyde dehydrogenase (NAD+)